MSDYIDLNSQRINKEIFFRSFGVLDLTGKRTLEQYGNLIIGKDDYDFAIKIIKKLKTEKGLIEGVLYINEDFRTPEHVLCLAIEEVVGFPVTIKKRPPAFEFSMTTYIIEKKGRDKL